MRAIARDNFHEDKADGGDNGKAQENGSVARVAVACVVMGAMAMFVAVRSMSVDVHKSNSTRRESPGTVPRPANTENVTAARCQQMSA